MSRSSRSNKVPQIKAEGSPPQGEPLYLSIGRIRRPHGFNGEILMDILTDFPERIHPGQIVYLGESKDQVEISNIRVHGKSILIFLSGIENDEQAGKFRNQLVFIKAENLPGLPKGYYYHHQLLNCEVVSEKGEALGMLEEIIRTGAKDVYIIRDPQGKEILLPALDSVILDIDLNKRVITVQPPEWE
jgi:16S rRNA processing protein RimM